MAIPHLDWFRCRLKDWGRHNLREFPWRQTRDPYAIFVAEFLLQKTTATQAERVYRRFLPRYPTLAALAAAPVPDLETLLSPLGLKFRAERLHRAANLLIQKHNGRIPHLEADLLELPGIGPYSAKAICAAAFRQRTPVLDVNVARILMRFFGLPQRKLPQRDRDYQLMTEKIAPQRQVDRWNLTLLDFGALICVAQQPACDRCPLAQRCLYLKRSEVESMPQSGTAVF